MTPVPVLDIDVARRIYREIYLSEWGPLVASFVDDRFEELWDAAHPEEP